MSVHIVNPGPVEAIIAQQLVDRTYEGRNLAELHRAEISQYANPWAWIKARIGSRDFRGIHVGDYIPAECTNGVHIDFQVMGINTYKGAGNFTTIADHIDFCSRDMWPTLHAMNKVAYNNGTSVSPCPWCASDLYCWLNSLAGKVPGAAAAGGEPLVDVDYTTDGVWHFLPADLQAAITNSQPKYLFAPFRYSPSEVLTTDTAWTMDVNMGKLWIPLESEVIGYASQSSTPYGNGLCVQYPLFSGNMMRVKHFLGGLGNWYFASQSEGNSINFAYSALNGCVASIAADMLYALGTVVCFRLTA